MPSGRLLASALIAATAVVGFILVLLWQPWDSDVAGPSGASDSPAMTLEGVIALVSREHIGCPEQPAIVLTADATYDGEGMWTVTYRDYTSTVNERDKSVRAISEPLPCPNR